MKIVYETLWGGSPDHVELFKCLIVKLSKGHKNLTGLTTACMIRDVRNDQVFQIFIDAY